MANRPVKGSSDLNQDLLETFKYIIQILINLLEDEIQNLGKKK